MSRRLPIILLYHRVADEDDHLRLSVPVDVFEAQIEFVRDECDPMSLAEIVDAAEDARLPDRAVAVTFDDGYADNRTVAAPILAAARVPATFFLTTAALDDGREYWWDTLTRLLLAEPELPAVLDLPTDPPRRARLASRADRIDALKAVHHAVRCAPLAGRLAAMAMLEDQIRPSTEAGPVPMKAAEIRALARNPDCRIGAHTVHHLSLPAQPVDVQRQEMDECRIRLEALTGGPVRSIAYPFGEASPEIVDLARDCGFTTGVVVNERPDGHGRPHGFRLTLPRVDVASHGADLSRLFGRSPRDDPGPDR